MTWCPIIAGAALSLTARQFLDSRKDTTKAVLKVFLPSHAHLSSTEKCKMLEAWRLSTEKATSPHQLADLEDEMQEAALSLDEFPELQSMHPLEADIVAGYHTGGLQLIKAVGISCILLARDIGHTLHCLKQDVRTHSL